MFQFPEETCCLLNPTLSVYCSQIHCTQELWHRERTAAAAKSLQSCLTLCDPIDGSPPGFPIPGILQARTLEWVAISFSNGWKWKVKVKSLSRVWLSDPMDCSLPGSSVHRIFQAKVLEWGATAFSSVLTTHKLTWSTPRYYEIIRINPSPPPKLLKDAYNQMPGNSPKVH